MATRVTAPSTAFANVHHRYIAIGLFGCVHIVLGVISLPALVLILEVDIAHPDTHREIAVIVLVAGVILTAVNTLGFSIGLLASSRGYPLEGRVLYPFSSMFSIATLVLAPLELAATVALNEHLSGFLRLSAWGVLVTSLAAAMLVSAATGYVTVRTCRRVEGFCAKCGYNLTGNVSGICPECGTPIGRKP